MPTKSQIIKVLKSIPDPELNISIWDLGLVYDIKINSSGNISILMTLTSIGCPLFNLISEPVKVELIKIKGVKNIDIELTFEPPWTPERMSQAAKDQLGFS